MSTKVPSEYCPSFHTTSDYIPVLTQQREDATALAADATGRRWNSETERHLKLINGMNDLITAADARGQPCSRSHENH